MLNARPPNEQKSFASFLQKRRPSSWFRPIARHPVAIVLAAIIAALHLFLPFRFPVPWPDEASFIAPAFEMARHGTLFVWGMNPDRVVMWMPPGYFLLLAAAFKLFGYSFALVRWLSAACMVGAAILVGHLVLRNTSGRGATALHGVTLLAFLSPYVLMSAGVGRMEALLTLAVLAALLACVEGTPVMGAAIVACAGTVHFNAVYFTLPFAAWFAWLLATRQRVVVVPAELVAVAVAIGVLGAYALFVRSNLLGFIDDVHFQLQLKRFYGRDDPLHPSWPAAAAGLLTLVVVLRQRRVDGAAFLALFGTSFVVMATLGKEIWYDLAPPIGFLLIAIALVASAPPLTFAARPLSVLCLAPCLACLVMTGYRQTPFLGPLLPTRDMLAHTLIPPGDIRRVRQAIASLPPGTTVEYAWGGVQPFYLDAMDRAGVRWTIPQHSVTDNRLDRRADWRVQCDSPDIPDYLRRFYPQALHNGQPTGCDLVRP